MIDQPNATGSQLPKVPAINQSVPATSVVSSPQPVVQQALSVLMNTNLSPYQMTIQFTAIKEDYLAKTYGITIG